MRLQLIFDFYFYLTFNPKGNYIIDVNVNGFEVYFMNWHDHIKEHKDNSIIEYENTKNYISFRIFGLTFVHYH
jgi:hypothetical protein